VVEDVRFSILKTAVVSHSGDTIRKKAQRPFTKFTAIQGRTRVMIGLDPARTPASPDHCCRSRQQRACDVDMLDRTSRDPWISRASAIA
jgi:hypothetical protein